MQVESAHARHAVALSTRRMRSNKIEFLPVEDEFKRKKRLKDKEIRLYIGELIEGYYCKDRQEKR